MDNANCCKFYLINFLNVFAHWFLAIVYTIFPFFKRPKNVKNEIILITGAGSGIGQLMAIEFAKLGAIIVAWDINDQGLNSTKKLVEKNGSKCTTYNVDVTDRHRVYEVAKQIKQEVGTVYILINNAGVVIGKDLLDLKDEEILSTMNVNTISHFWTVKAFLPDMIEKDHGHIVTIASLAGHVGVNKLVDYCASKFAAVGFDAALRLEIQTNGHNKIKTTVVCPWFINTGMFNGCSALLPVLEPKYVVDKIVNAVLKDQAELVIPRLMYALDVFKALLPTKSGRDLIAILGVDRSMNNFVGHLQKKK